MDKRIEKTKHMIKTTMLELMKKKPFNKITVKEICENAYTSRITFYTYILLDLCNIFTYHILIPS